MEVLLALGSHERGVVGLMLDHTMAVFLQISFNCCKRLYGDLARNREMLVVFDPVWRQRQIGSECIARFQRSIGMESSSFSIQNKVVY